MYKKAYELGKFSAEIKCARGARIWGDFETYLEKKDPELYKKYPTLEDYWIDDKLTPESIEIINKMQPHWEKFISQEDKEYAKGLMQDWKSQKNLPKEIKKSIGERLGMGAGLGLMGGVTGALGGGLLTFPARFFGRKGELIANIGTYGPAAILGGIGAYAGLKPMKENRYSGMPLSQIKKEIAYDSPSKFMGGTDIRRAIGIPTNIKVIK